MWTNEGLLILHYPRRKKEMIMGLYRVPMVLLIMFVVLVCFCSSSSKAINCDLVSSDKLRSKVAKHLYDIEKGLKALMKEEEGELVYDMEEFGQVYSILNQFLLAKSKPGYVEVEQRLGRMILHLSLDSSGTILSNSTYIPESVIDFAKLALIQAENAHFGIQQLIRCNKNATTSNQYPFSKAWRREMSECVADGTKCQYSDCAQGNRLPACAIGFATGVTGGASGSYYIVSRVDDNNPKNPAPGTLRHAVNFAAKNKGGAWIIFKNSMVIRLKEKLWINSDTTIDGRGKNVTIIGKGLALAKVKNVILHNLEVVSTSNSDTVHVFNGTRQVWIDHLTSRDANLGLVSVIQGSTDVTISNCYLSNHNYNMLLGASDQDTVDQRLRVTVYRNWFESSTQRMPHCRWGYCHVVNNYYRDWHYYAIGGRVHAKILAEHNVFEPGKRLEVTPWHNGFKNDLTPTIISRKDLLLDGATFHQFFTYGKISSPEKDSHLYRLPIQSASSLTKLVINCSGVLFEGKLKNCMAIA